MIAEAKSLPISLSYIHGDPLHSVTFWFDGDYSVRAIEAPDNTIIDNRITLGETQHPPSTGTTEIIRPSEAELTDEALSRIGGALETIGRMNAEIVLELTRAHEELTNISEARKRRERSAAEAAKGKIVSERPQEITKSLRPEQAKERRERKTTGKSKVRM
jgi:ABC-type sulfate/molybdate transport systems ATPase subunit